MSDYDAIIIGAGHNGLVAAAYLAKAGKKVLVLERRPMVGGIAVTEEFFSGFKYSTCAHLAGSLAANIIADLELKRHGLELLPIEPLMFAPSLEGEALVIPGDFGQAVEAIGRRSKNDAANYRSFCALLKKLAAFLLTLYSLPLPDRAAPTGLKPAEMLKAIWRFHRLGKKESHQFLRILPMSIADLLDEWFENDLLKAALAASAMHASFVGPRQQGTSFNLLHRQLGDSNGALRTAGFVRGGIGNLAQAIAGAARRYGADIRTGAEVAKIVTKNGAATAVALPNGDEIHAGSIISSADAKRTFLSLVDPTYLDPHFLLQVRNIRCRGTLAKVNLALDSLPEFKGATAQGAAAHLGGIIHIGPSLDYLERAADDAKYGRPSRQPFLEITIPTVADSSLAPAGKHVMSVWMQSAPYHLREGEWNSQRDRLGDTAIDLIEDYAPGFTNSILHRQVLPPVDLEQIFGLTGGHIDHAEMTLDQIFFMRPLAGWARYHTPIENLYLCGSGSHPGGGITGLPGYYAAKEILRSGARG